MKIKNIIKGFLVKISTAIFVFLFNSLDFFIWLLINLISSKLIIKIFTKNNIFYNLLKIQRSFFKSTIILALKKRECNSQYLTSCLSRCITAKLFFNLVGLKINLNLGFIKLLNGKKEPHAWLSDPLTGKDIFRNLSYESQVKLITYK